MDWKKRGIHLKSLRPDDPGHLALCEDLIRVPPQDKAEAATLFEPILDDPGLAPAPADLTRRVREELEEALGLLDQALELSGTSTD